MLYGLKAHSSRPKLSQSNLKSRRKRVGDVPSTSSCIGRPRTSEKASLQMSPSSSVTLSGDPLRLPVLVRPRCRATS
eukprot:16442615-Heterocapsa_arctica.AAC.1